MERPSSIRSQPQMEVLRLTDAAQLTSAVDEWRDLAAGIDGSSYFQTPDWVLSWWENRGRPAMELALWWGADRHLEAIAFLSELRERFHHRAPLSVRVKVNSGSGRPHSADHCGWPCLPQRIGDVREWIAGRGDRRSLLLRHLDQQTGVPLVPGGARLVLTTACPRIEIAGEGSLTVSTNFRQQLAARRRKLKRAGITFEWTPPEKMTADALDVLFALHESRRSLLEAPSSFVRERHYDLQRRLIGRGGVGRGPAMVLALRDGHPVGILYGFMWRDTFAYYQGGWDPAWARYGLGTVLVAESIRLAALNGARWFDFLRGNETYKYRFGAVDRVDETWLAPHGIAGQLLRRKYDIVRAHRTVKAPAPGVMSDVCNV